MIIGPLLGRERKRLPARRPPARPWQFLNKLIPAVAWGEESDHDSE
ncbi:MAG TPA: hypothetical protein VGF40_02355 [Thermoanaerobaculia bacterium]